MSDRWSRWIESTNKQSKKENKQRHYNVSNRKRQKMRLPDMLPNVPKNPLADLNVKDSELLFLTFDARYTENRIRRQLGLPRRESYAWEQNSKRQDIPCQEIYDNATQIHRRTLRR